MSRLRQISVLAVAVAALAVPSHALAETVLPPGNSAVNQYTQTFPTPKGNVSVEGDSIGQPGRVLGDKNTKKLDQQGADGRAAAELAAATSPSSSETDSGAPSAKGGSGGGGEASGGENEGNGAGGAGAAGSGGSGGGSGSGSGGGSGTGTTTSTPTVDTSSSQGSSGLGTVLGQATGSSTSGGLGLLMPLAIALGLIWCMAYLWRQRERRTA